MDIEPDQPFEQEQGARDETVRILTKGTKVFKRYTLIRIIGRGGMGVVWLAHDEELDRDIALKFLPESVCHDKEAAAELKRETRRSLDLTHPNIVRIYDFVHDDQRAAIAMEYIDGRSLSALKTQKQAWCFEVKELAPYVQQLCAALDYAHSVGRVVHQDLKPANLMVNSKGQLKVTDFGIARSISDSVTRITAEDTVGGTLVYMSPQQLNGEKASAANDIYSLGATIYDLLTSKPPFYTGSLHHQIENNTPPSMIDRRKELEIISDEIPAEWEQTIAACLAKKPEDRPATAAEVARRLGLRTSSDANWMTSLPGRNVPAKDFKPLKSSTLVAGLALMLLLAGVITAITYQHITGRNGATPTPQNNPTPRPGESKGSAPPVEAPVEWLSEPGFDDTGKPRVLPSVFKSAPGEPWENSLKMRFVPVGNTGFSIWETRVRDFTAFVKATKYDATGGVSIFSATGWSSSTNGWNDPGFPQSDLHPVTCVNWHDAASFCRWLTEAERKAGILNARQRYRMPTQPEWIAACDGMPYPWGSDWPPAPPAANVAGDEVVGPGWPPTRRTVPNYDDGFGYTAPAGSFPANASGIFDIAGNVWEWGFEPAGAQGKRPLHGAAWDQPDERFLKSDYFLPMTTATRNTTIGFRCVLEEIAGP